MADGATVPGPALPPVPLTEREVAQVRRSGMIRASLAEMGDDGTRPRLVSHYLFPDPAVRRPGGDRAIRAMAARLGLTSRLSAAGDGMILERDSAVAPAAFDALVLRIAREAAAEGWYYDGWESGVAAR